MVDAAAMCYVTQPTVSKAVKALEQEFGIDILLRNRLNQIQFTQDGELFVEKAVRILSDYEILRSHFSPQKETHLSVCSQHYIFVLEAFLALARKYSDGKYDLQLKELHTKSVIDEVYSGQSSLGIIFRAMRNNAAIDKYLGARDIEFNELGLFDFHAFLRIGHPLGARKTIRIKELEDYPFVCYAQLDYSQTFIEEGYLPKAERILRVCDRDSMYRILRATDAYTIGTGVLRDEPESDELISIPITDLPDKIHVGWIHRRGAKLTALEQEFIDLCTERLNTFRLRQQQFDT